MDKMREEFIRWVNENGLPADSHPEHVDADCGFRFNNTAWAWSAWQASRAAIKVKLPEIPEPDSNYYEGVYDGVNRCMRSLDAAGISYE